MKALRSIVLLIARWCLAAIFLFSGVGKFLFFEQTQAFMASKGFTAVPFFLVGAALLELIFALCLILGYKSRFAAAVLFLYLIPVTLIFHNFWDTGILEPALQQLMFLKNIGIMGGLLYVLFDGPGGLALDHLLRKKEPEIARQESVKTDVVT